MALINCGECGKQISDRAASCPHCGMAAGLKANKKNMPADGKKKTHPVTAVIAAVVGLGMFMHLVTGLTGGNASASREPSDNNYKYDAEQAVRATLKDPDSAKFGEMQVYRHPYKNIFKNTVQGNQNTVIVCGSVNAKNGYGGYTGLTAFVVVDGDVLMYPTHPDVMVQILDANCTSAISSKNVPAFKKENTVSHSRSKSIYAVNASLTASEADALRMQIEECWNVPIGARDAKNMAVSLILAVNEDRTVKDVQVVDKPRYNSDGAYMAVADSAIRAVRSPACSPLNLPPDRYDVWKNLTLTLDPKGIL